ncbi:MAG: alpha/beta fold hydrolase [Flavobacteriales bacterium]|nr:alpha/beta fold hydrolase [Flavobacteriales bacterium]
MMSELMTTVDLHFRRMGPEGATPVVILHGLFGSSDNWGSIGKELGIPTDPDTSAMDVLLVDLRDHGRSAHAAETSYPLMAADVHALVTGLGLRSIVLVGHSMGGKTAMEFAQRWPELVKRLIVVDISPKEHANTQQYIVDALLGADISAGRTRKEVEEYMTSKVPEPGVVSFLMKNLYWRSEGELGWRMNIDLLAKEMDHILAAVGSKTVKVPTLFIRGGQSDYILREDIPAIKEQFPNSRIETINYAGHWVHAQAPEEVIGMIRSN